MLSSEYQRKVKFPIKINHLNAFHSLPPIIPTAIEGLRQRKGYKYECGANRVLVSSMIYWN